MVSLFLAILVGILLDSYLPSNYDPGKARISGVATLIIYVVSRHCGDNLSKRWKEGKEL